MIAANFSEFRASLKTYLDQVEEGNQTLVIKRKSGKGSVVMSLESYNALMDALRQAKSMQQAASLNKKPAIYTQEEPKEWSAQEPETIYKAGPLSDMLGIEPILGDYDPEKVKATIGAFKDDFTDEDMRQKF